MKVECMCVVCHGSVPLKNNRQVTAVTCENENCHRYWYRHLKRGGVLSERYMFSRMTQQHLREKRYMLRYIGGLLGITMTTATVAYLEALDAV